MLCFCRTGINMERPVQWAEFAAEVARDESLQDYAGTIAAVDRAGASPGTQSMA